VLTKLPETAERSASGVLFEASAIPFHQTVSRLAKFFYDGIRGDPMAEPTYDELKARLAELEKSPRRTGSLEFRVGEKGGVSVYGLGRFPVTLYYEQWMRLLDASDKLREFLEENKSRLKLKDTGSGD
jgi:hypothetical protein